MVSIIAKGEFEDLDPVHFLTGGGADYSQKVEEFNTKIQSHARDYFLAFGMDVTDLDRYDPLNPAGQLQYDLGHLSYDDFVALLKQRYMQLTDYEKTDGTAASHRRAQSFIDNSKTKSELTPPRVPLNPVPTSDRVDQIEKLKEMIFPALDSAIAGLNKLTTPTAMRIPATNERTTTLRPLTLSLFVLSLVKNFLVPDHGESGVTSIGFTDSLMPFMQDSSDFWGEKLAKLFDVVLVAGASSGEMVPLGTMELMALNLGPGQTYLDALPPNFDLAQINLFNLPETLVNLAETVLAAHPEIAVQLARFEETPAYGETLKQIDTTKNNLVAYKAELDDISGAEPSDTARLMALIPNTEAQTGLLASLGIEPRVDPNGKKPSWMSADQWQVSRDFVIEKCLFERVQMAKSAASVAAFAFIGALCTVCPPALAAAAPAALFVVTTGYSCWDGYSTAVRTQQNTHAARVASQAPARREDDVQAVSTMPDLANDRDVAVADRHMEETIARTIPTQIVFGALSMGTGAGLGSLYQGATLVLVDIGTQTVIGVTQAFVDENNWTIGADGRYHVSAEALAMATVMSFFGAVGGHAVGHVVSKQTVAATGKAPQEPFTVDVDGKRLTIDPQKVHWQDPGEGWVAVSDEAFIRIKMNGANTVEIELVKNQSSAAKKLNEEQVPKARVETQTAPKDSALDQVVATANRGTDYIRYELIKRKLDTNLAPAQELWSGFLDGTDSPSLAREKIGELVGLYEETLGELKLQATKLKSKEGQEKITKDMQEIDGALQEAKALRSGNTDATETSQLLSREDFGSPEKLASYRRALVSVSDHPEIAENFIRLANKILKEGPNGFDSFCQNAQGFAQQSLILEGLGYKTSDIEGLVKRYIDSQSFQEATTPGYKPISVVQFLEKTAGWVAKLNKAGIDGSGIYSAQKRLLEWAARCHWDEGTDSQPTALDHVLESPDWQALPLDQKLKQLADLKHSTDMNLQWQPHLTQLKALEADLGGLMICSDVALSLEQIEMLRGVLTDLRQNRPEDFAKLKGFEISLQPPAGAAGEAKKTAPRDLGPALDHNGYVTLLSPWVEYARDSSGSLITSNLPVDVNISEASYAAKPDGFFEDPRVRLTNSLAHEMGHVVQDNHEIFYGELFKQTTYKDMEIFAEDYRIFLTSGGTQVMETNQYGQEVPFFAERLAHFKNMGNP